MKQEKLILFAIIAGLCLLPLLFLALRPAAQLAGWTKPELGSPPPEVEPDRVIPRRNYRSPLGLLILDRSGSMVKLDPAFFQSVAAEAFAFFFTRLMGDEVHPDDYDKMHFAVVLYPGMEQDGPGTSMLSDTGEMEGADAVIWGQNGSLWLQVASSAQTWKSDASQSSRIVAAHLGSILGEPGADNRRGQDTPYLQAVSAAGNLITAYRQSFPPESPVFAVFMTDAGFSGEPEQLESSVPGIFLRPSELKSQESAYQMIPDFLEALEMEKIDVTQACREAGIDLRPFLGRKVPLFIRAGGRPVIKTDLGQEIEVHGREGAFYALYDPETTSATRLLVEGGVKQVLAFKRHVWELSVAPSNYELLSSESPPRVALSYSGAKDAADAMQAEILDLNGDQVGAITLTYDEAAKAYHGNLPEPAFWTKFEGDQFEVVWSRGGADPARVAITLSRSVAIYFNEKATGIKSKKIDALPSYVEPTF